MIFTSESQLYFFLNSQHWPLNALTKRTFGFDFVTLWRARKEGTLSCAEVSCVVRSAAHSRLLKHPWPHTGSCVRALAELKAAGGVRSQIVDLH